MPKSSPTAVPVLPDLVRDHCRGPATAKLALVEYSDYEDPACAEAHWALNELVQELRDEVCVVFRNYPMRDTHPHAQAAAEAAEAADAQGKFWLMHDRLFEHQDALEHAHLEAYAREISLDMATFDRDLRSGAPARRVAEDVAGGLRHGVQRTPTYFVNGKLYNGPAEFLPLLKALKGNDTGHDRFDG
jgi:formate-nitrite transporter family protein